MSDRIQGKYSTNSAGAPPQRLARGVYSAPHTSYLNLGVLLLWETGGKGTGGKGDSPLIKY